ncbi:MAG: protein-disulfide reductase DsbD N-terminal domain-containing protein [Armatimonadetes bacterium]|nr:protein-disulfide reductase DsbD N-terminal domain-containing protein [Armatimonadota bacterium]
MKSFLLINAVLFTAFASAQDVEVKFELKSPKTIVAGTKFTGRLFVTLPEGWHAYGKPEVKKVEDYNTYLSVALGPKEKNISIFHPNYPVPEPSPFTPGDYIYSGTVEIPITFALAKGIKKLDTKIFVTYQICNDKTCLPPRTKDIRLSLKVEASKPTPKKKGPSR